MDANNALPHRLFLLDTTSVLERRMLFGSLASIRTITSKLPEYLGTRSKPLKLYIVNILISIIQNQ